MSISKLEAAELLSRNKFIVDEEEAHIVLDKSKCGSCDTKPCLYVCAALLYKSDKEGNLIFDYAGCLECGTCRLVCANAGLTKWEYPRGTFGISYRQG